MVAFATQVKRRRGTTAQNDAFTGAEGEIVVDTQRHELRVHDGVTRGGFKIGGDKANVGLDNLTSAGKEVIAHNAMPSDRYVDLTLGGSGATYTAPADGWFFLHKAGDNAGQFLTIINRGQINFDKFQHIGYDVTGGMQLTCFMPVKKGDVVHIGYSLGGQTYTFRFIYANGAQ